MGWRANDQDRLGSRRIDRRFGAAQGRLRTRLLDRAERCGSPIGGQCHVWLGTAALACLRMPIFGGDEVCNEGGVVMARPSLLELRRASERNQRTRFGGFTLPRRIGLAHRCVAFFRSHCDTVSIPDRSHFSYMALARHVPRAVNRTGRAKDPAIFKLVNADFRKYAGVTERRATIPSRRAYPVASACPRVDV